MERVNQDDQGQASGGQGELAVVRAGRAWDCGVAAMAGKQVASRPALDRLDKDDG